MVSGFKRVQRVRPSLLLSHRLRGEGGTQYQRGPRPQVSEGSEGKVLKMDGPSAQGFLSLTAFQAEGCGIALTVHSEHILKER